MSIGRLSRRAAVDMTVTLTKTVGLPIVARSIYANILCPAQSGRLGRLCDWKPSGQFD